MGIKNFMKIIQKYSPDAITYNKINQYQNKILAIDANLMIYKMIFAIRKNGYDLKNGDIIVTHLHSTLQKIKGFIKYNILPVFVFDGMAPQIKKATLQKRKEFQIYMEQKYYKAVTQDEKKKYYFMKSKITLQEILDVMELIKLFGYPIIEAPEEADSQLADLIKNKKVDYIVTDDLDILVFGGHKVLKNFTVSDMKKIQEIDLNIFKKETKLNQKQIVDLAILLGCDYCPTIQGVGTIGAYKLIQKYGTIEKILKKESVKLPYDYKKARTYFINPPINNSKKFKIEKNKPDKKGLKLFLEKFNYDHEKINLILDIVKN